MVVIEARIFPLNNPTYLNGFKELRDWESRILSKHQIQQKLETRFGEVVDPDTQTVSHKPFHEINFYGHCGEISRITHEIIGGQIKQKVKKGSNPTLYFINHFGKEIEIASGHTEAKHSYVVDNGQMVWDPITRMWGTVNEKEYLKRIINKRRK